MMVDPVVVLKCRECGTSRAVGYEAADHSRLDGCDRCLDFYCNAFRRFIAAAKCATCESHAHEAEKQRLGERKERIAKLLSLPGVASHSLVAHFAQRAFCVVLPYASRSLPAGRVSNTVTAGET